MSATSPIVIVGPGERAVMCASLRDLYARRVFWRTVTRVLLTTTGVLAALCVAGCADYFWPAPRAARAVVFSLALFTTLSILAHAIWSLSRRRTLLEAAREVERATGSRRNSLVTLAENEEGAGAPAAEPYMLARLDGQARDELERINERTVAPREGAGRGALAFALVLLLVAALASIAPETFGREVRRVLWLEADDDLAGRLVGHADRAGAVGVGDDAPVSIDELSVRVVPPAYSGLSAEEIAGDAPVRALAGSQVEVVLRASGAIEGATLTFNNSTNVMRAQGGGRYGGSFMAGASGAFEARVRADESRAPAPVVRAVEVYTDAPPEARITEPAGDQLLRSVPDAPLSVRWTARDDLGLAGVTLKYIKSRGLGDAAEFTNGELSVGTVSRAGGRDWQGAAALDLRGLDVQPGDTVVFWLEARDRNPAANNTGRSASLAVAVAAPELAKLNLSDLLPSEIGRFLLSQRAIILHTERLHAERARLPQDELKRRAHDIAAEQREFKNSFDGYVKTEGEGEGAEQASGDLEERVREAEDERTSPHFHGIPEPPANAPTAVKEMTYAIRAMWDAEEALTNADTAAALKHEREALARLKRAQASVRYIPPIAARSQPVDLKRRYAGELAEIRTRLEKLARRAQSPATLSVRGALADAYAALNDLQETLNVPASARGGAVGRARERARTAADRLVAAQGGDHAATIAEAAGQLRVVETELSRMEAGGSSEEYAARVSKPLALLTQAAANLFAIAESSTRGSGGDANSLLPTDDARAADYFRRLAGGH